MACIMQFLIETQFQVYVDQETTQIVKGPQTTCASVSSSPELADVWFATVGQQPRL